MPICVTEKENGLMAPVIHCDHCREIIETATEGNYHYNLPTRSGALPVSFIHKRCRDAFVRAHPARQPHVPLDALLVYLARNLKVDWEQAKITADEMGSPV